MKEKADDLILTAGIQRRAKDLHTVLGRGSHYRPIYCESGVSSTLMITSYRGRQNPILKAVTQNQCSQVKLRLLFVLSLLVNTSLDLEIVSCTKKSLLRCNKICRYRINPLNPELNPICYLLALLGAHHFLHVSRIRVKTLTFR